MNKEADKLLSLIDDYTSYCQNASVDYYKNKRYEKTDVIENLKRRDVLEEEIKALYQYKEDAEKWRAYVAQTSGACV